MTHYQSLDPHKPIVISVGGALLVPDHGINVPFLQKLNHFVRHNVSVGRRFFLVAGGGKTARWYRDAGRAVISEMPDDDQDWLGIHATRLNGHLLRTIFKDIAHPRMIENYSHILERWVEPVTIGAGWKPGWSTDYDAVKLAVDYHAALVINLSNIDYVFDSDPRTNPHAQPLTHVTWKYMEELVGTEWKPGMNAPFDPVASQLAAEHEIDVVVANGDDFTNLQKILDGHDFKGTLITREH